MPDRMELMLEGLTKNIELLTALQTRGVTGTPDAQLIYGPTGIFSNAGIENLVVNASIVPYGIDSLLPVFGSVFTDPIYPFLTGFESDGSAEPAGVCDNCPGGVIETCHTTVPFGRVCRESQEIEINTVMQMVNRGQTNPLTILGSVMGPAGIAPPKGTDIANWINFVTQTQMTIVGVEMQRHLSQQIYQGNPANNNAGGGYKEFPGLDILIATGHVDTYTNAACGALDSDIKDFNYNDVCGINPDIVEYISMMAFYLDHVAERTRLAPVQWAISMRGELFWELTACWPCRYLSNRCTTAQDGDNIAIMNDETNVTMRDAMRNGKYLTINGKNYPVITDDGIYEENSTNSANVAAGQFASDIYFLPLRAKGIPTLYWEHLDYTKATPDLAPLQGKQDFWSTDGGRYMWTLEQQMWCYVVAGKIEPRIVLRTPHLAGRIQNVRYEPLQHLRSPYSDDPYFVKGGNETYAGPSYYTPW